MTFSDLMFWVFAVIAVLPAFLILASRSIVRMAFLLLFSLAGFAGLYLQLGAGFLGFTQVMVYIGGILILFLFGVMLTQKTDLIVSGRREKAGPGLAAPGFFAGLLMTGALLFIAGGTPWREQPAAALPGGVAGSAITETGQIGLKLLGTYILPFEAVSILLLAAMVGATYIARSHAPGGETEEPAASRKGGAA